jgi:hypothetical protein
MFELILKKYQSLGSILANLPILNLAKVGIMFAPLR